jgi:PAS domain S-box-containing protein
LAAGNRPFAGAIPGAPVTGHDTMTGQTPDNPGLRVFFEKLFEFSPDAILVSRPDGQITEANSQAHHVFGYTREELTRLRIEDLIPERFRSAHPAHRTNYAAQPHTRPMGLGLELYARRKDGTEFPVDIMLSPVDTAGGQVFLSVVRDISRRKQAEEALRASEELFRSRRPHFELERGCAADQQLQCGRNPRAPLLNLLSEGKRRGRQARDGIGNGEG